MKLVTMTNEISGGIEMDEFRNHVDPNPVLAADAQPLDFFIWCFQKVLLGWLLNKQIYMVHIMHQSIVTTPPRPHSLGDSGDFNLVVF